ncbi:MAG: class I SAM-dependent methyltransferase [Firmicutes bacterium]|nr:class I SAM-dependent methyltransferase [Bacillota bacterium]
MGHYFTNDDNLKSKETKHHTVIREIDFEFMTDNGVFSKKGLDFGTRTLLESIPVETLHGNILDFGCGYGPIGIFLKKYNKDLDIHMIDINKRSLNLAKKNAILNDVVVNVYESDMYENVLEKFDYIVTNPPIRVGKKILYEILNKAKEHLNKEGMIYFVIHKDQGAKSIAKDMSATYEVEIIEKNKGFYVISLKAN